MVGAGQPVLFLGALVGTEHFGVLACLEGDVGPLAVAELARDPSGGPGQRVRPCASEAPKGDDV